MGYRDALRELLRSLCLNTHWKYAVLWKLDDQNHMQLSWEDAYFDSTKSSITLGNGFLSGKSGIISFSSEVDAKNRAYLDCPIEVAVANMSSHIYILGEGTVGNVASRKNHQWIFAGGYNPKLLLECHEECQVQFAAGIKTILLVPVIPLGVLQLGSLHMVTEDPTVVAHITDLFSILQYNAGTCIPLTPSLDNLDPYEPITMPLVEDLSASSAFTNLLNPIQPPISARDFTVLDFGQLQADLSLSQDVLDQVLGLDELSSLNQFIYPGDIIENCRSTFPRYVDEVNDRCLDFPFHSELHKALGLGSMEEYDDHILNAIVSKTDELSNSICYTEVPEVYESGLFVEKSDTEQLLDTIIAAHYASRSCRNSSENFPDSCLTQFETYDGILGNEDLVPRGNEKEDFMSYTVTNEEEHIDNMEAGQGKRGSKPFQRGKKRGRCSDSGRLRPRDRQLIQDRIKELRELIPDGSKCSIDILLDRTVKHMSFLQSIPCRAEKLRQSTFPKVKADDRNTRVTEMYQNGASWAYEVGGKPQVCPLIVEDLDQPGQMLVEMLCKEYGLFLEIVQVIKCLKLTILKGVLESRSDELWAHFIIEASRGFYRMDILLPLMQLLQRN